MIVQLFISIWIVFYFAFAAFTVYFVFIGKKIPESNSLVGKIIDYHGKGFIIALALSAIISFSFLFAMMFFSYLGGLNVIGY